MLLVVFGAGASYDSYPLQPSKDSAGVTWRPPLARELFSRGEVRGNLVSFPQIKPIVPRLYALPGGISLEEELEKLQQQADEGDDDRARQLVAVRYYLQSAIHQFEDNWKTHTNGLSNYVTLLDQIRRWRRDQQGPVCLATFNYDSMLEEARGGLPGFTRPSSIRDYVATDYKIFMLHGSVRWAREIDTAIPEIVQLLTGEQWHLVRAIINRAPELHITDKYLIADQVPSSTIDKRAALIPALAIPVLRKQDYECPADHIGILDDLMPNVNRVVMIGWRGREERFVAKMVDTLKKPDVRTVIVSGSPESAAEIRNYLQAFKYPGPIATATDGFSGFVLKEQLERFLTWAGDDELHLD